MQRLASVLLPLLLLLDATDAAAQLRPLTSGSATEFRTMHAPAENIVWAAGRAGGYAVTEDGGATWRADSVPGAGGLFFTGVWGRDGRSAHLLGTSFDGGLARIYRTDDGGASWQVQWEREAEGVFMDALRCWSFEHCVAFGDPVAGAFMIIRTTDGRAWQDVPAAGVPAPLEGEAGFAASGTALTTRGEDHAWIATGGGPRARVYRSDDGGATWTAHDTPLAAGATAGLFGVTFRDEDNGIAVGGDYQLRTERQLNVLRTADGGHTWTLLSEAEPHGVRYGAAYSPVARDGVHPLLAVGPSGVGISYDEGSTWIPLGEGVYNTLTFGPDGRAWVAGTDGKIAEVVFPRR